jgi:hypothetical protein
MAATVKVWTPAGAIMVKVNSVTSPILRRLGRSGGSYSARDAGHVATLTAHAAAPQAAK